MCLEARNARAGWVAGLGAYASQFAIFKGAQHAVSLHRQAPRRLIPHVLAVAVTGTAMWVKGYKAGNYAGCYMITDPSAVAVRRLSQRHICCVPARAQILRGD